ncbi:putative mitochondrial carrier protein [Trypanosoma cruzi]|uniref:Mitochondrial carrier protein n=2 Tax=Trypanosoma cruzi TaxID=5693 RepID=V5B150_TRYCR|nr:mitochondrial carrier protein [Trypanosoma cruzi Dm28c]PBJ70480.1 mitochondrial carrier protein [Trypanosoma cruzi cruzi]PWU96982.1 putative mitochondrial carrier protein [Trypanosoma cruzi]RNF25256.1 putative mitochondrial carrier protein [Trypanosoma cruzi]
MVSVRTNASKEQRQKPASAFKHTLSTQAAGALSTTILFPIDVVKMRFLSQDGTTYRQHNGQTYHSIRRALVTIYREEGPRALFRGCHVAVLGSVAAWGIYMYTYRSLHNLSIAATAQTSRGRVKDFLLSLLPSAFASCFSACICNPIWLIKTRMQLEEVSAHRTTISGLAHYGSFTRGLVYTVRSTGFLSLWRGLSAQILLGLPNSLNFPLYEALKSYLLLWKSCDTLNTIDICFCSTLAKTLVTLSSQPIYLIKTRLQDHRSRCGPLQYVSFLQSFSLTWNKDGLRGMYRGIVPSLLLTVPRSVLTLVFYEYFMHRL